MRLRDLDLKLKRKASWGRIAGLWLLLGSAALWAAEPGNANGGKRIVVLGDSITAGYGLDDPEAAYPAVLQKKVEGAGLKFTVVNAGVSGDTTAGGLRRVAWALKPGADVLVIALGGNDGLRGLAAKQTEENLTGIVAAAKKLSPDITILIAGMQMPANLGEEYVNQFKAVFPKVATESHAALIPFLLDGVGGDPKLNQADQIHPTAEGQKKVAETVWKVLEPVLKAKEKAPEVKP